ncbi:MAG TPA: hypothetical protein VIL78_14235 [Hanamia sp.]
MKNALKHCEFINSQTGNGIAYLLLLVDMDEKKRTEQLDKKKAELATFDLILERTSLFKTIGKLKR